MGKIEPESRTVRVWDINMHYVDWGGDGPPVLCVHGLTCNCRWWDSLAEELHPRYRVLAVDLRGRGDSDRPDTGYGPQGHARDLDAFMGALGLKQAAYAGHSMGANTGLYFAANYPHRVSKLILVDGGAAETPKYAFDSLKSTLQRLDMKWPSVEAYLDYLRPAAFLKDWNEYIETAYRFDAKQDSEGNVSSKAAKHGVEADIKAGPEMNRRSCYPRIACPTLILRAEYGILTETDWVLSPEATQEMLRAIPNAELVEIKGTNHFTIMLSKQESLDDKVLEFLAK